jgi:hypothetical protein
MRLSEGKVVDDSNESNAKLRRPTVNRKQPLLTVEWVVLAEQTIADCLNHRPWATHSSLPLGVCATMIEAACRAATPNPSSPVSHLALETAG